MAGASQDDDTPDFTDEELESIGRYATVVPNYASTIFNLVQLMLNTRLDGLVDELGKACNVGENLWVMLLPEMRKLVEQPSVTIGRRMGDTRGPVWGTKRIVGMTPWEIEHQTMTQTRREGLYLRRAAKIYDAFIGEYCKKVIDICDAAGLIVIRDTRFSNDGRLEGTDGVWRPGES